jgi:hypothetical protein
MRITKEMIDAAVKMRACRTSVRWLRRRPRTVAQLYHHNIWWAEWTSLFLLSDEDDIAYIGAFGVPAEIKALERGLRNAFPARKKR